MNMTLRIPRPLRDSMLADLRRRHRFAAERVGFAKGAIGRGGGNDVLVLLNSYTPVPDEDYVDDPRVGARINSRAIQNAMQSVLDSGCSLFHVHMHLGLGKPRPSKIDLAELPKLIPSFCAAEPTAPHGFLILTADGAAGYAVAPGTNHLVAVPKISVIGYPTEILL